MRKKRAYKRLKKRIESEFSFGGRVFKGISSNISERGLFLKTSKGLAENSHIEITLDLPGGNKALVKGVVRSAWRTDSPLVKNGMGIEVLEYDSNYYEFLKAHIESFRDPPLLGNVQATETQSEFRVLTCRYCGANNTVQLDRLSLGPTCGTCKESLAAG